MTSILQRLFKYLAYAAAGVVILLAVAVGLFRLFLPRLPEYQDEIKAWASAAIGMQVEFSGMDARWGLSGPQLEFYDAELSRGAPMSRLIAAEQVSIGVALTRLIVDRTLVVNRVGIRGTSLEVRQLPNGEWWLQGIALKDFPLERPGEASQLGDIDVVANDLQLQLILPGDEQPKTFAISRLSVRSEQHRLTLDGTVVLPESLGRQLRVGATQLLDANGNNGGWDVTADASDLDLAGIVALDRQRSWPLSSGSGDIDLSFAWIGGRVESAAIEFSLDELAMAAREPFSMTGRLEYHRDADGWLAVADGFRISSEAGTWPETALKLETSIDTDGSIVMLDARGDYVDLADLQLFAPLFPAEQRGMLDRLAPDGIVRNLVATISDIHTDAPRYAISADLENAGVAAHEDRPGVRGFTGRLRADWSGGRLEIDSRDMVVDLASHLAETIPIDEASGTVIWRRSGDRVTVLSDNIAISNADLESQSNIQVILDEGEAPVIDLVSRWSITDIGSAKRFIPGKLMHRKLYDWFQSALVSGSIPSGTTRLHGPLDKFPFDGGEGRFLLEANVRDTNFKFLPEWPAAEIIDMDVVLDNTRLYTERNRSINRGREVVNAKVEIDDLRKPVLTIDSYSTGTLESLHSYAQSSPIANVFGGHLRRVRVSGDAAFNLDLMVPIADWRNFTFTARLVANGGSLQVEGFEPPVTGLNGVVTIDRTSVTSEALGGTFLGRPVQIELAAAPEDLPDFQVVARGRGVIDAEGLTDGLGLPIAGFVEGETDYVVDLLFPRGGNDKPVPFTVRVASELVGLEVGLPEPLMKPAAEAAAISGEIIFVPGGQRIESRGEADGGVSWNVAFTRDAEAWDLERGTLALGGGELAAAETRGLHIRGNVESFRLDEWLRLSRGDAQRTGTADRIRSIDVNVGSLRLLGQHLQDHRVRVDRSARDWLVQFDGAQVTGSVFVPYDFGSDRAVVLDMERLVLPGDDAVAPDASGGEQIDPRTLPPITLKAGEFALGDRFLGSLEIQLARTAEGLVADTFTARDATFGVVGSARWVADATDPSGYRSHFMATLTSTDVMTTMQRLDYAPGIDGDDMTLLFDVSWSGGPRTDMFASLDGDVRVRFGAGQLNEVEPGAGRLFGLMSIVALPRRLSLDFTDVFDKGFGFDALDGTFRIVDGEAYTCDLSLEGPAANIAIIGRASLTEREYEQAAVVAANFGNTLPVVGAVVAGPQVAAALLIFSQIFKKPLQEMGQVYYAIDGSWDEPVIESTGAAAFATRAELAGCILESE
jgi:uncharacterized protein (TIGR02099 family)